MQVPQLMHLRHFAWLWSVYCLSACGAFGIESNDAQRDAIGGGEHGVSPATVRVLNGALSGAGAIVGSNAVLTLKYNVRDWPKSPVAIENSAGERFDAAYVVDLSSRHTASLGAKGMFVLVVTDHVFDSQAVVSLIADSLPALDANGISCGFSIEGFGSGSGARGGVCRTADDFLHGELFSEGMAWLQSGEQNTQSNSPLLNLEEPEGVSYLVSDDAAYLQLDGAVVDGAAADTETGEDNGFSDLPGAMLCSNDVGAPVYDLRQSPRRLAGLGLEPAARLVNQSNAILDCDAEPARLFNVGRYIALTERDAALVRRAVESCDSSMSPEICACFLRQEGQCPSCLNTVTHRLRDSEGNIPGAVSDKVEASYTAQGYAAFVEAGAQSEPWERTAGFELSVRDQVGPIIDKGKYAESLGGDSGTTNPDFEVTVSGIDPALIEAVNLKFYCGDNDDNNNNDNNNNDNNNNDSKVLGNWECRSETVSCDSADQASCDASALCGGFVDAGEFLAGGFPQCFLGVESGRLRVEVTLSHQINECLMYDVSVRLF